MTSYKRHISPTIKTTTGYGNHSCVESGYFRKFVSPTHAEFLVAAASITFLGLDLMSGATVWRQSPVRQCDILKVDHWCSGYTLLSDREWILIHLIIINVRNKSVFECMQERFMPLQMGRLWGNEVEIISALSVLLLKWLPFSNRLQMLNRSNIDYCHWGRVKYTNETNLQRWRHLWRLSSAVAYPIGRLSVIGNANVWLGWNLWERRCKTSDHAVHPLGAFCPQRSFTEFHNRFAGSFILDTHGLPCVASSILSSRRGLSDIYI